MLDKTSILESEKVLKDIFISPTTMIKDVLKKLNNTAAKVLLVVDSQQKLLGAITDGDIRRCLLSGRKLDSIIDDAYNRNPVYMRKSDFSLEEAKQIVLKNKIELLPVLDDDDRVVDFLVWDQLFSQGQVQEQAVKKIDIPTVIMAGGKGTRLDPFTKVLPKALIPLGDKTVVETIIDTFKDQGVYNYYLSLNHKSDMIELYFNNLDKDYKLDYIKEDSFLGTAGSLKFLEEKINDDFIVSNCDVIVKANLAEVLDLHKQQNAYLTILSAIQHYKIPYGVVEFKEKGAVTSILEKPEYTFTINTGVYVVNSQSLEFIPQGVKFDMTDLISELVNKGKKVITYPVNEDNYIDIGQWEEYKTAVKKLQLLR